MTTKELFTQYLHELDNMFTGHIFENVQDFKEKLLSEGCSNIMEVWYSSDGVLVYCEFDERTTIYETVDVEDFVDWLLSLDEPEDGGTAA